MPGKIYPLAAVVLVLFTACCGAAEAQYYEYAGALHMHTIYSDGTGDFDRLAAAGRTAGVDFLVTSDHDTLRPIADGREGWYDGLLILVGIEISVEAGHYFAMNLPFGFTCEGMTSQECINAVNAAGGIGFLAHPVSKWEWKDWTVRGYTGIEIVNLASLFDDTVEAYRPGIALRVLRAYLTSPTRAMLMVTENRPAANLAKWDELLSPTNKVVGIGSSDAHERVTVAGRDLRVPRYEESFRAVQTRILADRQLTGNLPEDKEIVYSALRNGRAYAAFSLVGDPRGTAFTATSGGQSAIMGQSITLPAGGRVEFRVSTPDVTGVQIRLLRDGSEIQRVSGRSLTYRAQQIGVYRVEVYRDFQDRLRPWVLTNPIYIRR